MLVNNAELDDEFFRDLSQKSLKGQIGLEDLIEITERLNLNKIDLFKVASLASTIDWTGHVKKITGSDLDTNLLTKYAYNAFMNTGNVAN